MSGCYLNIFPSTPPQALHAGHRTSIRPDPQQPAQPEDPRAHRSRFGFMLPSVSPHYSFWD